MRGDNAGFEAGQNGQRRQTDKGIELNKKEVNQNLGWKGRVLVALGSTSGANGESRRVVGVIGGDTGRLELEVRRESERWDTVAVWIGCHTPLPAISLAPVLRVHRYLDRDNQSNSISYESVNITENLSWRFSLFISLRFAL
jgi:hypothetical protein